MMCLAHLASLISVRENFYIDFVSTLDRQSCWMR